MCVAMLLSVGCHATKGDKEVVKNEAAAKVVSKIKLDMYVMSQCPYGVQAEDVVLPILAEFKDLVEFKLFFIGDEAEPGVLVSMHGEGELKGDLFQICTAKHAPDKFIAVLACMNEEWQSIPDNFGKCAETTGLDIERVKACAEGDEGRILLMESFKASEAADVAGSPTIRINGQDYDGPRTAHGIIRAMCDAFGETKPELCLNLPEPTKIRITIITDKRCDRCQQIAEVAPEQLKNVFPGLEATVLDYADEAAKTAYAPLKGTQYRFLPAVIFDKAVMQDPSFPQLEPYFIQAGEVLLLAAEAEFDPEAEICDNKADDDNNGKVDCEDDFCKPKLPCRSEIKGRLEVFVMSQCPYGAEAVLSMKEVLAAFGKKMDFSVHFLAAEPFPGQFTSLHGASEVAEDLRQVCAQKYYKKANKFMEYFLCRAVDYSSAEWEKCAVNGIKAAVIKKCSEGDEGRALLSADITYAESLGMNASPTWVANNNSMFSGISALEVQEGFCAVNKDIKACEKPLSDSAKVPTGACGQ